ncbi:hypothetical protein L1887_37833 [Cichorium endivia]|nr:hypothetical protein L1887_37833 [Cichorium endivia]
MVPFVMPVILEVTSKDDDCLSGDVYVDVKVIRVKKKDKQFGIGKEIQTTIEKNETSIETRIDGDGRDDN